ncbi:N-6 DNA methylase [Gordonia alkaliphila]|uniref:DNA methylase adenine-specific domain-containing protein n=1 Tax=Gordonia alkaliphila TaxID=1053547 RepID=A0ABP8Z400_9ACTN
MPSPSNSHLGEAFRSLYFHLYSNGQSSRAERIVEDMTLALLVKLAAERAGRTQVWQSVLDGADPALLLDLAHHEFPGAISPDEAFHNDDAVIRDALRALSDIALDDAPAHIVGDAFQAVLGPRIRGEKGQFFTPRTLVRAIVSMLDPADGERVVDPSAGSGGFLAEAVAHAADRGARVEVVGADKDFDLYRLMTALLAMVAGDDGRAFHRNSLDPAAWIDADGRTEQFDVVATNPPFGARIGVTDPDLLRRYDFGHVWTRDTAGAWTQTEQVEKSRDPQILFVELCVRLLRPGGRMGIVLPEGVFGNLGSGFVWTWLRRRGTVDALLDCPRTTFQPGTDTKTNVLFFTKNDEETPTADDDGGDATTWIAAALHCGHDRRGKSVTADGAAYPDDFADLAAAYPHRADGTTAWSAADLTGHTYLVPRYFERPAPRSADEQALLAGAEWVTLGQLREAGLIRVRKGREPGSAAYGTGDIPFIRTSDLNNFEVSTDPTKSVSEAVYREHRGPIDLRVGDVLIVVDGRYRIGAAAMITERNVRSLVQSHLQVISVSPDAPDLDPYALLFALTLPSVRHRIRDLVFVQSTLGTLGKRLFELEIPLLGGPGPWTPRVQEFARVITARDRLLGELETATAGETFEL